MTVVVLHQSYVTLFVYIYQLFSQVVFSFIQCPLTVGFFIAQWLSILFLFISRVK